MKSSPSSKNPISAIEKENIKDDLAPTKTGIYDKKDLVLVSTKYKGTVDYQAIATALKDGKVYVLDIAMSRNTAYIIRKKLKEEFKIDEVQTYHLKGSKQVALSKQA